MVAPSFHAAMPRTAPAMVAALAGCGLLLARPWLVLPGGDPTLVLVLVFAAVGVIGACWPVGPDVPRVDRRGVRTSAWVALAGIAGFAAARLMAAGAPAAPAVLEYLVLNTLAAVAEEALFRRLLYDVLAPYGASLAVAGSAAAFAVVHVTVWGAWVLPLDLAAGLVLSWQRHATGRWSVPAVTHVAANVLAIVR
jgi:membrane protease YdiL (CAAX protease family)